MDDTTKLTSGADELIGHGSEFSVHVPLEAPPSLPAYTNKDDRLAAAEIVRAAIKGSNVCERREGKTPGVVMHITGAKRAGYFCDAMREILSEAAPGIPSAEIAKMVKIREPEKERFQGIYKEIHLWDQALGVLSVAPHLTKLEAAKKSNDEDFLRRSEQISARHLAERAAELAEADKEAARRHRKRVSERSR